MNKDVYINPCLFARAVVSASLPDLSCSLLSIHCFCCIVPLTNKHNDDADDDADDDDDDKYIIERILLHDRAISLPPSYRSPKLAIFCNLNRHNVVYLYLYRYASTPVC